jgi:iron(III) transport system substrate-binding protein
MLDLAQPEWKGQWAAAPSGADFQAIVGALLQLKGEAVTADWLKGMKENAMPVRGNSAAMRAANAGELPGSLIYHYYYFGDQAGSGANSNNIALHYFRNQDPGAFVSISGGGVLASSKHKDQALAFIKWATGKAGQDILRTGNSFEYAVVGDSNPKLEPLSKLDPPKIDPSTLDSKKVIELMTAANLL